VTGEDGDQSSEVRLETMGLPRARELDWLDPLSGRVWSRGGADACLHAGSGRPPLYRSRPGQNSKLPLTHLLLLRQHGRSACRHRCCLGGSDEAGPAGRGRRGICSTRRATLTSPESPQRLLPRRSVRRSRSSFAYILSTRLCGFARRVSRRLRCGHPPAGGAELDAGETARTAASATSTDGEVLVL